MSLQLVRSTFYNLLPYLLFGLGYYLLPSLQSQLKQHKELLVYLPYLLFFLTALMSLHFSRHRVFFCLLQLTLLYMLFAVISERWESHEIEFLLLAVGLLLPLNLALVSLFHDRGLASLQNYGLMVLLLLELGGIFWMLADYNQQYLQAILYFSGQLTPVPGVGLPPLVLITVGAVAILLLVRLMVLTTPINNSLLALLILVSLALNNYADDGLLMMLFTLGGLILLISLVQDSYNMAYRDELTGLKGRRALNEYLARLGRRYVIAMVDIDFFKKFNDNYGHDVGDQVLKLVAGHLMRATGGAHAYRYGGEEFTLVFPRKQIQQVRSHLEVLREMIAAYPLVIRSEERPEQSKQGKKQRKANGNGNGRGEGGKIQTHVAVSIGIAERNSQLRSPEDVIKAADQALYQAKKNGRNRLECY